MILNTNRQALLSTNALWHRNNSLEKASTNLSTGTKVNKAGDDPTGMAVANKMRLQLKGLEMADRNVNDAVSLIQTAEGGLAEMQNIVQRMRELAVQSSNDTLAQEDRELLQKEVVDLSKELTAISDRIEFNKMRLLNDDYTEFTFHTGSDYRDKLTVSFERIDAITLGLSTEPTRTEGVDEDGLPTFEVTPGLDYTTVAGSLDALGRCDEAIKKIDTYRANIGANQNRLDNTSRTLVISQENAHAALSRVIDTDMAGEMAEYTKNNVLVQAGISMLTQANQRPNQLLSLLQ